jgi:hypothetical protein
MIDNNIPQQTLTFNQGRVMKSLTVLSNTWKPLSMACLLSLVIGCASTQEDLDTEAEFSGYLGDYSKLKEIDSDHLRWYRDDFDGSKYPNVYFEDVEVYAANPEKVEEFSDVIKQVTTEFNKTVRAELGKNHEMVNQVGPGVLHIQSAFTSTKSQALGMTGWEIMPVGAVVGASLAASGKRPRVVQMVWELKAFDGETGELVAQAVKKGTGDQESYQQVTMEDFLKVVHDFAKESGERLNKVLNK